MTTATDRSDARTIGATFDKLDQTPPKAIADAYARYERITSGLGNMAPATGELAAAVVAAIDAGTDPAADPTVQRLATAQAIATPSIMQTAPSIALDEYRATVIDKADAIVSAWAKPFDAAAARLADAFDVLGDMDLENTAAVVTRGGGAAEAWGQARSAEQTIDTVRRGWLALYRFTTAATVPKRYAALPIVGTTDADTWTVRRLDNRRPEPWRLTRDGLPLALSTVATYRTAVADIDRASRALAARAQAERQPRSFEPGGGRRTAVAR